MAITITDSLGVVEIHNGTEIHVTKDGKFAAIINGARVTLSSKPSLRRRIEGHQQPIVCMSARSYGSLTPKVYNVVRITNAHQVVYLEERHWPKGEFTEQTERQDGWHFYDEAAYNELCAIAEQVDALHARRSAILNGLAKVNQASFLEAQRSLAADAAEQPEQQGARDE